jgi:2-polyprenyl-3-methyl-5-hydroxy-6-metoxy-1,4-benzoquinol methylase
MLKRIAHQIGRLYVQKLNKDDALTQKFRAHNERPIEYRFVFQCLMKLRPVTVLDVGTGTTALPSLMANCGCVVTAIDNVRDYWPDGMVNRHWLVIDDDIRKPRMTERFDAVTCVSVIEHIEEHVIAFRSMIGLLKPGGHLILTTPYNEHRFVPNVYALPGAAYGQGQSYICRCTSRRELAGWLRDTRTEITRQEFWQFWSGEVWTQGTRLGAARQVTADDPHQLTCLLIWKPHLGDLPGVSKKQE